MTTDDGLSPNRWQHITWTNDGMVYWRRYASLALDELTHWGRVTHICVGNLTITCSGNGLSPGRRQAITWTNTGILLIGPLGTNCEILIEILTFSFKICVWKCRLRNGSHVVSASMCQWWPRRICSDWFDPEYCKHRILDIMRTIIIDFMTSQSNVLNTLDMVTYW